MSQLLWPVTGIRSASRAASVVLLVAVFAVASTSRTNQERSTAPIRHSGVATTAVHQARLLLHGLNGAIVAERVSPPEVKKQPASRPDVNVHLGRLEAAASPVAPGEQGSDEVSQYLWGVYQRSGTKLDSSGDFSWKDAFAAARLGMSAQDYVIDGMDRDFRELLFAAGQAMDAAGIDWTILSAFRDDYRQSLAAGYKAHARNSFHGGSVATGGYGHGCAVDLASTDGLSNHIVWNWLDLNGERFGLYRPLREVDPAHVQPRGAWHELGVALRDGRLQREGKSAEATRFRQDGLTDEQFMCVRPTAQPGQSQGIAHRLKWPTRLATYMSPSSGEEHHPKDAEGRHLKKAERHHLKHKEGANRGTAIHHATTKNSPSDDASRQAKAKPWLNPAGEPSATAIRLA
jgi:hypothetical protein